MSLIMNFSINLTISYYTVNVNTRNTKKITNYKSICTIMIVASYLYTEGSRNHQPQWRYLSDPTPATPSPLGLLTVSIATAHNSDLVRSVTE